MKEIEDNLVYEVLRDEKGELIQKKIVDNFYHVFLSTIKSNFIANGIDVAVINAEIVDFEGNKVDLEGELIFEVEGEQIEKGLINNKTSIELTSNVVGEIEVYVYSGLVKKNRIGVNFL